MVLDQIREGRPVAVLARELEVQQSTLHRWNRQNRIDRGLILGVSTSESAELAAACRRIRELEAELAAVKRATKLFDEERVMRPKDLYPIVEALGAEGHGLGVPPESWRRSGLACRPSCSTPNGGRPASNCPRRPSTGSRPSTIEPGATWGSPARHSAVAVHAAGRRRTC